MPVEPPEPPRSRTSPGRVVVVGSLNLDSIYRVAHLPGPGETTLSRGHETCPGGKGANQAFAAARAGARVVMVGACGDDSGGDASCASLRAVGVDTTEVLRAPGRNTGSAIVVVADDGENQIVVDQGANLSLDEDVTTAALDRLCLDADDILLVSFEIPEPAVTAAVLAATGGGSTVVINPAPFRPLDPALCTPNVVLTPNASEALALAGTADVSTAAERLARMTGGAVLVTRGEQGSLVQTGAETWSVPALPVSAVDTTGAGDVLSGVLAAALSEGLSMRRAAVRATVAASLSVRSRGARGGIPRRADVDDVVRDMPELSSR